MTPNPAPAVDEHHIVISADCHAGSDVRGYRTYLESKYHTAFDEWADSVEIGYQRLNEMMGDRNVSNVGIDGDPAVDGDRNWSTARRLREQEADGVVGEVIFPNTQPPFAPLPATMFEAPPLADDPELRFAGLRAHNRWLADFVSEAPERRAGVIQVFLGDVEGSVRELEWGREHGLRGGMLLPGAPPGSNFEPLYAPAYEPLWSACVDLDLTVSHHSGGATPDFGSYFPASMAVFMLEVTWWSHRALWHLMFSGVFERHPNLRFVNTESGTKWIVDTLAELDSFYDRMKHARYGSESIFGAMATANMPLRPSEYWRRQCAIGASFLRPVECDMRHQVGIENIAWGNDYPHIESSHPFTRDHLRLTFGGVDPAETTQMITTNAARLYHFDLDALSAIAARVCPTKAEVARPVSYADIPESASKCPGMAPHTQRAGAAT